MKPIFRINPFLQACTRWAAGQPDVQALALVGSHASGAARADSDVDLVVLTENPSRYLDDTRWTRRFGEVLRSRVERYGDVTSLRVWYADGPEVEFGLATPVWAAIPLDGGTHAVVAAGMQVLFERQPMLSPLLEMLQRNAG